MDTDRKVTDGAEDRFDRRPMLSNALRNTGIFVLYQDRDLKVVWAENWSVAWSITSPMGLTDGDLLPDREAARLVDIKRRCLVGSGPDRLELRVPGEAGRPRWFDLWIDADRAADGSVVGVVTTAVEITEQKYREQTMRALLLEVSHRSKNLLAIIQSVALQTGRHSISVDAFLRRFRGRLQSLADTQDLVTSSNWRGAELRDLVLGQVARYVTDPKRAVRLQGESPYLNPNAALHIGMALHELVVNSVSYGALTSPTGQVTLTVTPEAGPPPQPLLLTWDETIPPDSSPTEGKFGSVALQRVVPAALNGSAALEIERNSLRYWLRIPAGSFEAVTA